MPEPLFENLISNDPVISGGVLRRLTKQGIVASEFIKFINDNISRIKDSPTARYRLAQLSGGFSQSVVNGLIDCIKSPGSPAKFVAAQCMRFMKDADSNAIASGEMHGLLNPSDPVRAQAAIEALGNLGAVTSGPKIRYVAESDDTRRTLPYALKALFRLIPAETIGDFVSLRFGDFNALFSTLSDIERNAALSQLESVLPELRARIDGRVIDLIMHTWVNSSMHDLRILGAKAIATLRIARARYAIENRIDELIRNGDLGDNSIYHLAFAWGNIGVNPSSAILQQWYDSSDQRRNQCARIALSVSFPALMADRESRYNDFWERFKKDELEGSGDELQAHIILGAALTEQNSDLFLKKLNSTDVITRAAAAIGLAMRTGEAAEDALKEHLRNLRPTSIDRLFTLSAMSRFRAAYANQLHKTLCSMPPLSVWRIRDGTDPTLIDRYRWTAELITALRRAKRGGVSRARAWAEVLMFDDNPEAIKSSTAEIKLIWRPADHPNHPNIARLYKRMDRAYEDQDYAAVLHASASIFETVVKLKFRNQNVETQTLGGLFDGYRRRSELPAQILDFIRETYKRRNTEPLSGHGATRPPSINRNEAKALKEFTKVIVRLEYP